MLQAVLIPKRFLALCVLLLTALLITSEAVTAESLRLEQNFVVNTTEDTFDESCDAEHCSLREAIIAANFTKGPDIITLPPGTYVLTKGDHYPHFNAPVEEEPIEEEPIEEQPVEEAPIDEEPAEETPVEPEPINEEPVEEEPGPAGLESPEGEPVEEEPIEVEPVREESVEETSEQSIEEAPTKSESTQEETIEVGGSEEFAASTFYQDTALVGDLDITDDVTIVGAGADVTVIDAGGSEGLRDRIFHIHQGNITISGLTIRGGYVEDKGRGDGAGINHRGGSLTLQDVIFHNNLADHEAGGLWFAGHGPLVVQDSQFLQNQSVHAGAVFLTEKAEKSFSNTLFLENDAVYGDGGGIDNNGEGPVNVIDSTFTGNTAADQGGAIDQQNGRRMTIKGSTFNGNRAAFGGAIFNGEHQPNTLIENSTFFENEASHQGGALWNTATASLTHVTVSGNSAPNGKGGGLYRSNGQLSLVNTIVTANNGGDCAGQVTSLGHNIASDDTCQLTAAGDQPNTDPLLGELQDNGGPTATQALLAGSPAVDTADSNVCLPTDQRGISRPQGDACDIGAYESEDPPQPGPIFTVNSNDDSDDGVCSFAHCSLREAIQAANARFNDEEGTDQIQFNLPGEAPFVIQPLGNLPAILDPVLIDGGTQPSGNITLDGSAGEASDGLIISGPSSTVQGLTITGFFGNGILIDSNYSEHQESADNNRIVNNTLSANGANGVLVLNGTGNQISQNSIADNGALGIDLGGDGSSPNDIEDTDLGPNDLQNFPVLTRVVPNDDAGTTTINGRLNSTPDTEFTIELFANNSCDPAEFGEGASFLGSVSVTTNESGNAGFETTVPGALGAQYVAATATGDESGTSEFSRCVPGSPGNDTWIRALRLNLVGGSGSTEAEIQQLIDTEGQSRWYKFQVKPNSRVIVTLTDLPANYDLTLFKDINQAFLDSTTTGSTTTEDLVQLSAEFAPDAFSPDAFSPDAFSPDAFSPDAFSPDAFSPDAFSPDAFSPDAFSPDAFSPDAFSPDAFSPDAFSPDAFSPDAFSPDAFSPDAFSPDAFSPDAFSSAQTRSLLAVSAFEGNASEGIIINTWNNTGDFYVRVRGRNGAFNLTAPFRLHVVQLAGACDAVSPSLPATTLLGTAGGYRSLILTAPSRMQNENAANLATLSSRLQALAGRSEVDGVVVDVTQDARVAAANAQADANPTCPFAKNLVAESIKMVVDNYRDQNPDLEYIVIAGNDFVIPFFRHPDQALLASEINYVPPVSDNTPSQASLRLGYVLSQDRYGSRTEISYKTSMVPVPDLAVGRLVETSTDMITVLDAYLSTANGVLPNPASTLVTGYDFLADAAQAIQNELNLGTGVTADTLITPRDVPPTDPSAWTATQLSNALLGSRHDMVFLAGHFSANSALAADYTTRLLSTQLVSSPVNLTNSIIFSAGCHAGYSIVNADGIPNVTREPDWAQAFAQKGATLIAGTGYQYGDTDFIEYSERLYLEFSRELRTGSAGPVSVGNALVAAKQTYLAETPQLRGIHEKSLLEATIYGLPMLSVNMTGSRITPSSEPPLVTGTSSFSSDPGATLGLKYADTTIPFSLETKTVELTNTEEDDETVIATYLQSPNGKLVSRPTEPTLPLEMRNAGLSSTVLRGVGFRGGSYQDLDNIIPLTGAPTTEVRGVHSPFLSDIFFPVQLWSVNYYDTLASGDNGDTKLSLTPAQFRSSNTDLQRGTLRKFNSMDFRLYYSDNTTTFANTGNTPALSAPPAIVRVMATENDGIVIFEASVVGDPAAGMQEVWVTYTATNGPFYGKWQSLDLVQDANDSTRWTGALNLNGTSPDDVRYMVQATNGVGLVGLSTNLGAYHIPGVDPASLPPTEPTTIVLDAPITSAPYGTKVTFSAMLTSNGSPLSGKQVSFRLGAQTRQALTDESGRATVNMPLLGLPGEYEIRTTFAGDSQFGTSTDQTDFTIFKQSTKITLDPKNATGLAENSALMVATLEDATDRRLGEKTVIFVISGSAGSTSVPVITDYAGRATLGEVPLAPGSYEVTAYFAGSIPLHTGEVVTLNDDRYEPAVANGSLTLSLAMCDQILDDFNRSGIRLGSDWFGFRGQHFYQIIDNQVQVLKGGPILWKRPAFGPDQEACVTLTGLGDKGLHSLLLKVQKRNFRRGTIQVFYDPWAEEIGIKTYERKKGWRVLDTVSMTLEDGVQLAGQASADGLVRVFVDGEQVLETHAGSFFAGKGGYIGLWFADTGKPGATFDDFAGK